MLCKISESQKDKYCIVPYIANTVKCDQFPNTENKMAVVKGLGKGIYVHLVSNGYRVLIL